MQLNLKRHALPWLVALAFCMLAYGSRRWMGYPNCPGDESNWIAITVYLRQGIAWPISGPGFIHLVEMVPFLSAQSAVSLIGIVSVFFVIISLIYIYAHLLKSPLWCIAALAMSTYFWAPLLEARPQQLGQILVIIGLFLFFQWLETGEKKYGTLYLLALYLVSYHHILSHAILIALCALTTLGYVIYQPNAFQIKKFVVIWLGVVSSLLIHFSPNGPYQTMTQDLLLNHFHRINFFAASPILITFFICFSIVYTKRNEIRYFILSKFSLEKERQTMRIFFSFLVFCLLLQSSLLPSHAWNAYHHKWSRFIFWHLGDFSTGLCFLIGLNSIIKDSKRLLLTKFALPFLFISLMSIVALSGSALLASIWMLDVNWLLRIVNYGLLFAAPIIAVGLMTVAEKIQWAVGPMWLALVCISLISVWRHPSYFGC